MTDPAELLKGTTPGPWRVAPTAEEYPNAHVTNPTGALIAEVTRRSSFDIKEREANALLIAAAPELAQFVTDYLAYYRRGYPNPHEAENLARRAKEILARVPAEVPR